MVYELESIHFDDNIIVHIVEDLSGSAANSIVVYESPGNNGGFVINTGRLNEKLSISGKILTKLKYPSSIESIQNDVINKVSEILDVKDMGIPIKIVGNIPNNRVDEFLITSFNWNKPAAQMKYITFMMELTEYRQVETKQNSVNLVGDAAINSIVNYKISKGFIS